MFEDADMRVIKMSELKLVVRWIQSIFKPGGGGLPYESDGDARRKIRINTLKETNLDVAPALFNP